MKVDRSLPWQTVASSVVAAILLATSGCAKQVEQPPVKNSTVKGLARQAQNRSSGMASLTEADVDRLLQDLRDKNPARRNTSQAILTELYDSDTPLSLENRLKLVRAAGDPAITRYDEQDNWDASGYLMRAVYAEPDEALIPTVVEGFAQFSDLGKAYALRLLTALEQPAGVEAWMQLIREHAASGRLRYLASNHLRNNPRHAEIIFPELLKYADRAELADEIYHLCLAYFEAHRLTPETLAEDAPRIIDEYSALVAQLQAAQQPSGVAWMWEDDYGENRHAGGLLIDLLQYLPDPRVDALLREALALRDPRLKYFAIRSLLNRQQAVEARDVADVAAHAEMRGWLFDLLNDHKQPELFPDAFRNQAALAEADMVQWLVYPTELARVPDEIELMKVVPIDTGLPGGVYDYYVFRFRTHAPHWAADDGWMAGVSGPFLRSETPTTSAYGHTFSSFAKWDEATPEERVGDITDLLNEWREYHAQRSDESP